jgi:RNA polymerase sigma factor (sigma-70 family)
VRSKFFRLRQGELRQARLREALGSRTKHSREVPESLTPVLTLLPPPQQEILSLFYLEGLSLAETGMVLGIPARAAKQRLFRAREALKRQLGSRLRTGDFSTLL